MRSSNLRKSEAGQVLVYVTIVLMLTLVIIPPLLGFISGSGRTAQIREDRMLQVYAADAGIEDGYYRITGNSTGLPQSPGDYIDLPSQYVNGCNVTVAVYREAGDVYKIVSTATSDSGVSVTIEAWAASLDYSYLLDNALSSYGDIILQPNTKVYGNVTYNDELDNKGEIIDGNATKGVPGWPDADELDDRYLADAVGHPYGSSSIQLWKDMIEGPLYREGTLDIYSSNSTAEVTLTVLDTFYVTDTLKIGTKAHPFVLDLNNQTIFCAKESESENDWAIDIGDKTTITGSGCIIALGDIRFMPNMQSGPDDFVFVMSVGGDLQVQPGGDFYGAMAGLVEILYRSNSTIRWREYSMDDLNFPEGDPLPGIRAYIIRY